MKRVLATLLAAIMLLTMMPTAVIAEGVNGDGLVANSAQMSEGTFNGLGTEEQPFEIDGEDSLRLLATLVNEGGEKYAEAYYVLTSDISLSEAWTPIGTAKHPFCGSFDGNGKKLAGLSADEGKGCFGLFGETDGAVISGVALDDVNIDADGYDVIGAIVGNMQGGSLSESYVAGTVNGDSGKYCGGLVGYAEGAEIANCFSTVEMTADGYVGGIAGFACDGAVIEHCYNIGFIYSTGKGAFGSVLGNTGENIDLSSCYCIDTTDKGAVFLSRDEAADADSFAGFDFDGVWFVDKDSAYPYPVLKANPCQGDAKWAPDTTEYETGYIDNEEHTTSLSKNAMLENDTKDADAYASYYLIPNLPAVRNQSPYGTCWAHSILAAAETNLIKKGYVDSSVNLSELQFVWFHHNGTLNDAGEYEDPLNNFGGDRNYSYSASYGVWGGDNYYAASKSAASWMGLINEDETTAYSKANAESIVANGGLDYSYAFSKDAVHLENVKMIPANSGADAIKKAILKYGAISFSYMVSDGYTTSNEKYYYSSIGTETDHAVCIVGWDDKISKDLFYDENNDAVPKNDGAWIVRNSWGSSWGDSGYFYMSYESSFVTSASKNLFAFDFEMADNYEKCYQYDGSACYTAASGYSSSKPAAANIFTASGNDTISAVSFWMEDNSDLNYTVKVYTDITDGSNPTSGTLAASVSGQTDYAGYYTVALPNPVSVISGTKFSVVLQIMNSTGETIYFPLDVYRYYNEYDYYDAHSEAGQSFLSSNGVTWTDKSANNGGNFRIKAFTADNTNDPRPLAPTVSVSTASGKMALSWSSVNNAAGYTVYRALTPDGSYSQVGTTASTSYTDTTAVSGTVYYYKVTAFTANGNVSRYSNTVSGLIGTQTSFIVSYDAHGGSAAPAYQIKTAGKALTLSEEVPYKKGYTFLGWSEDSSAKTADYAPGASFTKNADTILYAVWIEGIYVNSPDKLESDHNYENGIDWKWYFTAENAVSITLTFDTQTRTEANYDFIYIYDGNNNEIGKYSGTALAGQTVTITGDAVCIRLTSDGSYNYYGFKVSSYDIAYQAPHTVKFVNDDGTELQSGSWDYGTTPSYTGATPTKASTAQYTYIFKGWSPAISAVTEDTTYTAQYTSVLRKYTVQFVNHDGTVLQSSDWDYGSTPIYTGTPTKAPTETVSYTFTGWTPTIAVVTGEASYTAQFREGVRQYTVKFVNDDGTVLQSSAWDYGSTPSYLGNTPTKASTAQYSYTFTGWSSAISAVTGDATYTAQYSSTVRQYTVKFVNGNTVLQSNVLTYGATPSYTGTTPTKAETAQYTYAFSGWSPAISAVTGDVTYTAQFKSTVKQYTITFVDENGTVLKSSKFNYGTTPTYTGTTPTKPSTVQYTYTFSGWSPTVTSVTGDATYTAQYTTSLTQYTVQFKNYDGTVLQSSTWGYGTTPSYSGKTPTKPDSTEYSYTFSGWSPSISAVTGAASYTAQFVAKEKPVTATSISISPSSATLRKGGQTLQLTATTQPAKASNACTWKSSNTLVATVDSNGLVKTKSITGTATITATTTDGSNKSAKCTIKVVNVSVTLYTPAGKSPLTASIKLSDGTQRFTAKVTPSDASQAVTWSSSNTSVATVDQYGNVTPKKKGLCRIKVKTTDGSNKTDSILINVKK